MKYINILPALFCLVIAAACGSSSSEENATPAAPSTNLQSTTPATVPMPASTTQPATLPATNAPVPAPTVAQPAGKAGLNPEHGKPGHRCDIAVGAPLDSKPTVATTAAQPQVVTQQPQQVNIAPAKQTVAAPVTLPATGAGLNPEHGKPGHRCDIAVGAPLNSKPAAQPAIQPVAQPTMLPATNNNNNPQPIVKQTPTTLTTPPAVSGPAPANGLNPEHGKPGHRCDLAVGAPLNGKPKQ